MCSNGNGPARSLDFRVYFRCVSRKNGLPLLSLGRRALGLDFRATKALLSMYVYSTLNPKPQSSDPQGTPPMIQIRKPETTPYPEREYPKLATQSAKF